MKKALMLNREAEEPMTSTESRPVAKIFNGRYTIESKSTGEHRTFQIKTQAADAEFAPGKRVLALLTGSQNDDDSSYTGFAFLNDEGIRVWRSRAAESDLWDQYAEMLWTLALDGAFSPWASKGYRILMEGACVRCNRPLTTPESIRRGIGPVCADLGGF